MKLLQHKTSKDTAIEIYRKNPDGTYRVTFWNVAGLRIDEPIFPCGYGDIRLQPRSEYKEIIDGIEK